MAVINVADVIKQEGDDTRGFERAIERATPGGTVQVPPGRYRIKRTLTLQQSITMEGLSRSGCELVADQHVPVVLKLWPDHVTVKNLLISREASQWGLIPENTKGMQVTCFNSLVQDVTIERHFTCLSVESEFIPWQGILKQPEKTKFVRVLAYRARREYVQLKDAVQTNFDSCDFGAPLEQGWQPPNDCYVRLKEGTDTTYFLNHCHFNCAASLPIPDSGGRTVPFAGLWFDAFHGGGGSHGLIELQNSYMEQVEFPIYIERNCSAVHRLHLYNCTIQGNMAPENQRILAYILSTAGDIVRLWRLINLTTDFDLQNLRSYGSDVVTQ